MGRLFAFAACALLFWAQGALAQTPPAQSASPQTPKPEIIAPEIVAPDALAPSPVPALRPAQTGNPVYRMTRIQPSEAPTIDGDLSDAVWARASEITGLLQTEPTRGAPATERTVVKLLYDSNNLYIYVYCYDSEPDLIVLPPMVRDSKPGEGDFVRIFIDPKSTKRNAYVFDVNPSGGRSDALVQNNNDLLDTWDTIWNAKSHIVADGWVSEIAIPFRNLSYDEDASEWSFDFFRLIRRKTERSRWGSTSPSLRFVDISQSGTLTDMSGVDDGLGLDIQAYLTGRYKYYWRVPQRGALSGSGSANIFYRITPALTGTVTVNPDFSDTPLDERQVNTSRFSLFLPETRDFFLQDVAAFEFGGFAFVDSQNARPFFSRNIGSVNGMPVSILGGGKLSGSAGPLQVGALTVYTDKKNGTPRQLLSTARVTAPLSEMITVGAMGTNGDPTGKTQNSVAGADIRYFNTRWMNNATLQADVFFERSFSSAAGEDNAFGAALHLPNEPWKVDLRAKEIGKDFTPALGFANRTGVRDYAANLLYRARIGGGAFLRWIDIITEHNFVTDLHNVLESRENRVGVGFALRRSDFITISAVQTGEFVKSGFNLPGGVPVAAGKYEWTNANLHIETQTGRPYSGIIDVLCCNFYDGNYLRGDFALSFRVGDYLAWQPRYTGTFIRLPSGDVDIHVLSSNINFNFTPDMQLALQMQFDNISRNFGGALRYRWEYAPGDEIFAALVQSAAIPGETFEPQTTGFALRLGRTLRY